MFFARRRPGFSLLEIMFVIGILGILLALGVGRYRAMQENTDLNTSAQDIAGAVALARQEAIGVGSAPVLSGTGAGLTAPTRRSRSTGRFLWRVEKNGIPVAEGKVANLREVLLEVEPSSSQDHLRSGSALVFYNASEDGKVGSILGSLAFEPDGSPLGQSGAVDRSCQITISSRSHSQVIKISSMGAVEGPTAGAPVR